MRGVRFLTELKSVHLIKEVLIIYFMCSCLLLKVLELMKPVCLNEEVLFCLERASVCHLFKMSVQNICI